MGVAALEARKDRPFVVRHDGAVFSLPDPKDLPFGHIYGIIQVGGLGLIPGRCPIWKLEVTLDRWLAHHGLGERRDVARAAFLVEKYEGHLTWDLRAYAGVDLGAFWRARHFRELLAYVDHLPRHSFYSEAVSNDPEHARQLAEAQARAGASGEPAEYHPPLTTWTPEVGALADAIDAINGVAYAVTMTKYEGKGKKPEPPKPYSRPKTALQGETKRAERRRQRASHEALVARMLPHKRKQAESAD